MTEKTRWALITGASSGIGLELARVYARHGYNLVLTARREQTLRDLADELKATHGTEARVVVADLKEPDAPRAIFVSVQRDGIAIESLVNNAGFASYGFFSTTPLDDELRMLQVNVSALTHLTGLFLPAMLERRSGRILNVASTAAFQPGPYMAVYYASKAYVLSFSEAVGNELRGTGVSITALCPGLTQTEFQARAEMEASKLATAFTMSAREVAEAGYRGCARRQNIVIPGRSNVMLANLHRFLPRGAVTQIIRRVQEYDSR